MMLNGESPREQVHASIVRSYCVLVLVTTFCAVFVMGALVALRDRSRQMLIATESFLLILNTALIWWFKSRDDKMNGTPVTMTTTPEGTTTTTTVTGAAPTRPEKGTP